jgi:CRP-like cAMP-binding protein
MLQPNPPFHNLLLQELPEPDFDSIAPYLETRSFKQGTVLFEAGAEQERVYFPVSGMVSLVTVMRSGHSIETAVVGREGFVGAVPKVDVSFRYIRAIVLLPATIYVLPLDLFVKAMAERPALHDMSVRHNESLLAQIRITAACNALHQASAKGYAVSY